MSGFIGFTILLIFGMLIFQVAAQYFKIPEIVIKLVWLLAGFWFVYNFLDVIGLAPAIPYGHR